MGVGVHGSSVLHGAISQLREMEVPAHRWFSLQKRERVAFGRLLWGSSLLISFSLRTPSVFCRSLFADFRPTALGVFGGQRWFLARPLEAPVHAPVLGAGARHEQLFGGTDFGMDWKMEGAVNIGTRTRTSRQLPRKMVFRSERRHAEAVSDQIEEPPFPIVCCRGR